MKQSFAKAVFIFLFGLVLTGCATPKSYDYTHYRAHFPKSILVLPPLNESTSVEGTYSMLSTMTVPIVENGYYVFPVAVVDHFFRENGMPTAFEMHQAPLHKIREIFGSDAVLYMTLKEYGTKFQVFSSVTRVSADARLVDTQTGLVLWEGRVLAQEDSSNSQGGLLTQIVSAAVHQIINKSTDRARKIAEIANMQLKTKLLNGPYHPLYGVQQ
jgi:hypothetical protein